MASKSLILALALATTAGAKGIRGLNFGNYYDTCVTTDIEKENKCQDYSCRPGATLGADKEFGADANCGENYPEGKTACQDDPDCTWVTKPTDDDVYGSFYFNHDYCVATDGEQPVVVDKKNIYFYPRKILAREYIQNEDIPGRPIKEGTEGPFNYYRLTVAMQCPDQSCNDLKMDNGVGDYFRMLPASTIHSPTSLITCDGNPADAESCSGTFPAEPDFIQTYPGDKFYQGTQVRNAGRAYSQVSDPGQKGSVEFIIKMDNAKQAKSTTCPGADCQIGSSVYGAIAPIGSELLLTKRPENSNSYYAAYPGGYYDAAKELHPDLRDPTKTLTINVIATGIGMTETAIVMLSELLKDPSKKFATVEKVNFLWSQSYFSEISWAYTQQKTNDLVRAMMKSQGLQGARFKVGFAVTTEPSLPGAYVPEADYTSRVNPDVIADFFNLEKYPATPPGPETKWLVVGSQDTVALFSDCIIRDVFGFDFYMNVFGQTSVKFPCDEGPNAGEMPQGWCREYTTDPDNYCFFGIGGSNCVYQWVGTNSGTVGAGGIPSFVGGSTMGTDFQALREPSPLASRAKPYILEAECPACDASNCGGCIYEANCVQAGCTWTPGTIEGGEEVDAGTCAA